MLKWKVINIPFEWVRFVDRQCPPTRTRHETERYLRTGHLQESRFIIEYNKFIHATWLRILIRRRQYLQYANDFMGFQRCSQSLLTCSSTITSFPKPKMFAWLIQFIKKILPSELCIQQLEVLLNPNPCHFCKRRTRFFHWLTLWLS